MKNVNSCFACGKIPRRWMFKKIISDELSNAWNLSNGTRRKLDLRESQFCPYCGNSTRTRTLAQAIVRLISFNNVNCLKDWVTHASQTKIRVAEINSCGNLHMILNPLDNLSYSEYPSSKLFHKLFQMFAGIRKEDITNLSYDDCSFDLVIHSDILEHVYDVGKALKECRRILKPKGMCLFTAPVLPDRKTKLCATMDNNTGKIIFLKPPSFHGFSNRGDYLVWWEFGFDMVKRYKFNVIHSNPSTLTYVFGIKK